MKSNILQYKKELIEIISKIAYDKQLLADFIKDILTPKEFENLSVRWQIVKRLSRGELQESIAEDLHTGISTVTRGAREIRKKDGGFQRTFKMLK